MIGWHKCFVSIGLFDQFDHSDVIVRSLSLRAQEVVKAPLTWQKKSLKYETISVRIQNNTRVILISFSTSQSWNCEENLNCRNDTDFNQARLCCSWWTGFHSTSTSLDNLIYLYTWIFSLVVIRLFSISSGYYAFLCLLMAVYQSINCSEENVVHSHIKVWFNSPDDSWSNLCSFTHEKDVYSRTFPRLFHCYIAQILTYR